MFVIKNDKKHSDFKYENVLCFHSSDGSIILLYRFKLSKGVNYYAEIKRKDDSEFTTIPWDDFLETLFINS